MLFPSSSPPSSSIQPANTFSRQIIFDAPTAVTFTHKKKDGKERTKLEMISC